MPGERDNVALKRSSNALDKLMNRLKNIEKFIDAFDPLLDERLLLDENLNTVKTIYKDYQAKLSDLMEVIPPDQFLERATKVEQFDLRYTKTIAAVKRLIIQIDPPGRTENGREEKPEVTTKIRLPDNPLQVFSGNLNEWVYFREKLKSLTTDNVSLNEVQKHHY
jgi:hypothetical protein